jgi:hypothetical protein
MDTTGMVKVFFRLDPTDWHGPHFELLWAEPVKGSEGRDLFVLQNSPFYTREVSYLDIVRAVLGESRDANAIGPPTLRKLDFAGLVDPSGHSTYRFIIQDENDETFQSCWKRLSDLGCSYENGDVAQGVLYSIDVPRTTDIAAVESIMQEGAKNGIWTYEHGRIAHRISGQNILRP